MQCIKLIYIRPHIVKDKKKVKKGKINHLQHNLCIDQFYARHT